MVSHTVKPRTFTKGYEMPYPKKRGQCHLVARCEYAHSLALAVYRLGFLVTPQNKLSQLPHFFVFTLLHISSSLCNPIVLCTPRHYVACK